MSLQKDLADLVQRRIISTDQAEAIRGYYREKTDASPNRLFIAFGVLGALLVGLGVILIVAHNWDDLPRALQTVLAFAPMVIGQALCGVALFRFAESTAWRESAAAFLFFAVGACMALIGQIYNIPGSVSSYLLTWMLLCLPLMYVMRASFASLLYWVGITYYACDAGYGWSAATTEPYLYGLLLLAALPYYYLLYQRKPQSNFTVFHHWLVPLSLIISLGTFAQQHWELMFVAYMSLFGLFYLLGRQPWFDQEAFWQNGYRSLGSLGTIVLLLVLSFSWFWEDLARQEIAFQSLITSPEWSMSTLLTLFGGGLLYRLRGRGPSSDWHPMEITFLLFGIMFALGWMGQEVLSMILVNAWLLALGVWTIREGGQRYKLGLLNYGMLVITALVICRFFDTDMSFVLRGLLFVLVGAGFFAANYWMLQQKKRHA